VVNSYRNPHRPTPNCGKQNNSKPSVVRTHTRFQRPYQIVPKNLVDLTRRVLENKNREKARKGGQLMNAVTKWKPSEIDSMLKLGKRVATLQEDIPCRDGGIPLGYVDSVELAKLSASDDPSLAIVPISFLEGFPTVNGVPIWERLEGEPLDMYELFRCYLHLPATNGRRAFAAVASRAGIDVRAVTAIASLWHWTVRAAAYDQFKEMER